MWIRTDRRLILGVLAHKNETVAKLSLAFLGVVRWPWASTASSLQSAENGSDSP